MSSSDDSLTLVTSPAAAVSNSLTNRSLVGRPSHTAEHPPNYPPVLVIATHRYRHIVRHVTGVQLPLEPQHRVRLVLVAQQQDVVLGRVHHRLAVAVLFHVAILREGKTEWGRKC